MLAMFPLIASLTTRATPGHHNWRYVVLVHIVGSLIVAACHITLFILVRKLIFLVFYGEIYIFTEHWQQSLLYEYRKDGFTYSLFLFFITFGRLLYQQRHELTAAREDAHKTKKLTLKSGGRAIFINASDVIWTKSAANYVEVFANGKTHLARATLNAIETQMIDAGASVVRVHRSYVINTDHIKEMRPSGDGNLRIEMSDGTTIPGGRRYRENLQTFFNSVTPS